MAEKDNDHIVCFELSTDEPWSERDVLLINLKIVSKMKPHSKLNTKNCLLYVDDNCDTIIPTFLRRYWRGDDRISAIRRLVDIADKCEEFISKERPSGELEQLQGHLKAAKIGISSLKVTYRDDPTAVASLDRVIDRFAQLIISLN